MVHFQGPNATFQPNRIGFIASGVSHKALVLTFPSDWELSLESLKTPPATCLSADKTLGLLLFPHAAGVASSQLEEHLKTFIRSGGQLLSRTPVVTSSLPHGCSSSSMTFAGKIGARSYYEISGAIELLDSSYYIKLLALTNNEKAGARPQDLLQRIWDSKEIFIEKPTDFSLHQLN